MNLWEDARVIRGMRAQLELRRKRLAAGDAPLGWKVGFAAPAMLERLNITGPLVGFLTRNARVQSGGNVSLAGWAKPVAEPEIAVHIGRDVSAGADHATAEAAIAGISPAIEIVDLTAPPEDPERILSGNIYQRHVVLDGAGPARARPIPGSGSASCATSPTCSRPSASSCAAEKSSSPGRWCRRSRSSRARMPSLSRSIRSAASGCVFPASISRRRERCAAGTERLEQFQVKWNQRERRTRSYPPPCGEGRLPKRSEGGRGGGRCCGAKGVHQH